MPKRTMDPLTAFDLVERLRQRLRDEASASTCRGRKRRYSSQAVALDVLLTIVEGTKGISSCIDTAEEAWRARR